MANQEVPMTTFLGKYKGKANIPFRGICPFHLPRDIFKPYEQKSGRKLYSVYIARWTSTTLLVPDWNPTDKASSSAFFHQSVNLVSRSPFEETFSGWISRRRTRRARRYRRRIRLPSPHPSFWFHFCTLIVMVSHCKSHGQVSNELPDRKLPSGTIRKHDSMVFAVK